MSAGPAAPGRDGGRQAREPMVTPDEYDAKRAAEVAEREDAYLALLRRMRKERGPAGEPGKNDGGHVPPVTPFLLVRCAPTDLGARPIAPGTPFWVSPDIWVESSDPGGNPVAGEPNTIVARVFNLGAFQASPVQVDFYWADPSLGLVPSSMNHIGTAWTEVPSLTSVVVPCPVPWVPTLINDGHECAMVNVSNWLADPITSPFDPVADRHVGQRNLHVLAAATGGATFALQLINPFPFRLIANVTVRAQLLQVHADLGGQLVHEAVGFVDAARSTPRALLAQYPRGTLGNEIASAAMRRAHRHPVEQKPDITAIQRDGLEQLISLERTGQRRELPFDLDATTQVLKQLGDDEGRPVLEIELAPNTSEVVQATIKAPDDLAKDEVLVIKLAQRAGDVVLGGYTVVVAHV